MQFIKDEKIQKQLQEQFILVEDGGTIELPEGSFLLSKALSIEGKNNITIKGKGRDKISDGYICGKKIVGYNRLGAGNDLNVRRG